MGTDGRGGKTKQSISTDFHRLTQIADENGITRKGKSGKLLLLISDNNDGRLTRGWCRAQNMQSDVIKRPRYMDRIQPDD